MEKSNSQKVKVGIFVVVGTVLLIAALYFIGSKQQMFSKNIEIYATFSNVNGLTLGNNVRYSGINVGTITNIEMKEVGKITIEMSVEEKSALFIKKSAIASISSDGLVGSMVVNIEPGDELQAATVVSGDFIQSYNGVGTADMMKTLNKTNENAALLTADLLKITNKILEGEGALGALITDSTLTKDIRATLSNFKNTTDGTDKLIGSLNYKFSKIDMENSAAGVLLNDKEVGNQIHRMITNLETSSSSISKATVQLETMISEIKTSKSTLNYLTKDETLPKTIDATMLEINEASEKLNENMEALKHNFLFRGYFKKQERKAKKEANSSKE